MAFISGFYLREKKTAACFVEEMELTGVRFYGDQPKPHDKEKCLHYDFLSFLISVALKSHQLSQFFYWKDMFLLIQQLLPGCVKSFFQYSGT